MKPEIIRANATSKKLSVLDVEKPENCLALNQIFLGDKACTEVRVMTVLKKTLEAYRACAKFLQQRMPINNLLLGHMSSLDPTCHQHEAALHVMKKLTSDVPSLLTDEEREKYDSEVHIFHSDPDLPSFTHDMRLDTWWSVVFECGRYPALPKCVFSIIHLFVDKLKLQRVSVCMKSIVKTYYYLYISVL